MINDYYRQADDGVRNEPSGEAEPDPQVVSDRLMANISSYSASTSSGQPREQINEGIDEGRTGGMPDLGIDEGRTMPPDLPPLQELIWRRLRRRADAAAATAGADYTPRVSRRDCFVVVVTCCFSGLHY